MKRVYNLLIAILFSAVCFAFAGCSDSGEDDVPNISTNEDYIEVTINGKTYHHSVRGLYGVTLSGIDGVLCYSSMEDVFEEDGFNIFYTLNCYEDLKRLLESPTGNYDIVTTTEDFSSADNLSFYLNYEDGSDFYEIKSGSHKVTSIKAAKVVDIWGTSPAVQVEGSFDLIMTAEYYTGDRQCKVKGRYRMSIY